MADTYTTNLNLTKPEPGAAEDTWGISLNADLDSLDAIFSSSGTQINLNPNQINFADNKKAIFGNSSDLQIYHDGSHSYIYDGGVGDLKLQATNLLLEATDGTNYIHCADDGAVRLYYNGFTKLATTNTGIDVTGTVTADGLTVDGALATINSSGSNSDLILTEGGTNTDARIRNSNGILQIGADINNEFGASEMQFSVDGKEFLSIDRTGDISFYDDTGTTQALFWDASAESLGIGTTSPSEKLHVNGNIILPYGNAYKGVGTANDEILKMSFTSGVGDILNIAPAGNSATGEIALKTTVGSSITERLRIDSSGNVGIGVTSPTQKLYVKQSGASTIVGIFESVSSGSYLSLEDSTTTTNSVRVGAIGNNFVARAGGSERMRIDSSGNVGIGTTHADSRLDVTGGDITVNTTGTGFMNFKYSNSSKGTIGTDGIDLKITAAADLQLLPTGNVGIGTSSPAESLHTTGNIRFGDSAPAELYTNSSELRLGVDRNNDNGTSNITFYVNNSETARIDATGNVGIGTTNPVVTLTVDSDAQNEIARFQGANAQLRIDNNTLNVINLNSGGAGDSLAISTGSSEAMRIDSSGNVGIGTTAPSTGYILDARGWGNFQHPTGDSLVKIQTGNNTGTSLLYFSDSDSVFSGSIAYLHTDDAMRFNTNATERMRIDSSGRLNMMSSAGASPVLYHGNDLTSTSPTTNLSFGNEQNGALLIYTNSSERMRIDASGNLLVGKTSASSASIGFQAGQDGFTAITRASAQPLVLNRTTNDGIIAEFKRDSTQVGNIGCPDGANGSQLVIAAGVGGTNTGVGLRFTSFTVKTILPCYDDGSNHDDEIDLGTSSARFDDIYATNGTIQTSDRNDKQDIEEITDAETRVAVACKGLIRKFRWKSAVAEKDDNSDSDETARIHFGIIAQDLQDAFTAEGLDAGDYAMFTSQTWEDSDGVEQTRLGVRYSELLAFIIAAI